MPVYAPNVINNQPGTVLSYIPDALVLDKPHRFVPKLRSGYFYLQDRRHVLFSKKASGYLEDMTWYSWKTSDIPIEGSERVWVRGAEVTATPHYRFKDGRLQINGGSITHPGTLVEEINYDISFLDPIDLGAILNTDDEARIEYDYYQTSVGTKAAVVVTSGVFAGISLEAFKEGSSGNNYVITINASSGAGTGAVLTDLNGINFELDWFDSTTVEEVLDAINLSPFIDASTDGVGDPTTDLFADLLTSAAITPPDDLLFIGGTDAGFVRQSLVEIFKLRDSEFLYELPHQASNNLPVVMTDDRMNRWDRRDVSPEFVVNADRTVEFNVPRNYIDNYDYEGDLSLWLTAGNPEIRRLNNNYAKPKSYSASRFVHLPTDGDSVGQFVRSWDQTEQLLMAVARGATGEELNIEVEFFDVGWTSLGSEDKTFVMEDDWKKCTITFGPLGQIREYDFEPPAEAYYALITITPESGSTELEVDYVFWGRTAIVPDAWTPHGRITVEYDIGSSPNYIHDTLIVNHLTGEPRANLLPLENCNMHGSMVSDPDGFLYFYEYNDKPDFKLGLGGINAPLGNYLDPLPSWPITNGDVHYSIPSSEGGFYVIGDFTDIGGHSTGVGKIKKDGSVDTDFTVTLNGEGLALYEYDGVLYLGGEFTSVNGEARSLLAAVDTKYGDVLNFDPNVTGNQVRSIVVDEDNVFGLNIIIGGDFTDIDGTGRNHLGAVDVDGNLLAFNPNLNDPVNVLLIGDDRNLYVGGEFTQVQGGVFTRNHVARWLADSLVFDATFNPNANDVVHDLKLDGVMLLLAGEFSNVGGAIREGLAEVNVATNLPTAFDADANDSVYTILTVDDFVIITGVFNSVDGEARPGIAKLNRNGSLTSWVPNVPTPFTNTTSSHSNNFLLFGGSFTDHLLVYGYYDSRPVEGRRWLPYAKVDGLGKLRHVAELRHHSTPWVREVTETSIPPVSNKLELLNTYGYTRAALQETLVSPGGGAPAILAGARSINIPGAFGLLQKGDYVYFKDKIHPRFNTFQVYSVDVNDDINLSSPIPVDVPGGMDVFAEYRQLKGFVGQQRVVRLRLTDQYGAPVGQHPIKAVNRSPDLIDLDWDLPTDQNGEVAFLITFKASGSGKVEFSGSGKVTLNLECSNLPAPSQVASDQLGPNICDTEYNSSVADWS